MFDSENIENLQDDYNKGCYEQYNMKIFNVKYGTYQSLW